MPCRPSALYPVACSLHNWRAQGIMQVMLGVDRLDMVKGLGYSAKPFGLLGGTAAINMLKTPVHGYLSSWPKQGNPKAHPVHCTP